MTADCRAAAARVVAAVIDGKSSLDAPLAAALDTVASRDKPLLQELCYGTLRSTFKLQGFLEQTLKKPLKARDSDIHALLLCGLHQLLDMRTPDHAAISTTVEACRALGKPWATGLVNGVLRRCRREEQALAARLSESQRLSHPPWLLDKLKEAWPRHWMTIVDANNGHPPMCLRVNCLRQSRDAYLEELLNQDIAAVPCELSPDGLRLERPSDVAVLPGFESGRLSVQDEAAQLSAGLLAPEPGERVLDACCAPGGKACHLLEYQPGIEELVAMDSDQQRLERVRENLARIDLQATLVCADARRPPAEMAPGSFDRILVDAPCSGTGVIRRHPDIKLLRRESDIAQLAQLQLDILTGLWPLLRPGGALLYVTCSVLPEENAAVVSRFLASTADARSEPLEAAWGEPAGVGRQLLPRESGPDGMFFARLAKNS